MAEEFNTNFNSEEGDGQEKGSEKGLIERMQEKLYSRTAEIKHRDRTKLRPKKFAGTEDWEGSEDALRFEKKERLHHTSLYTVIFLVSITFFVVAGALAGFMLLNKKQAISPENVSVTVFGPVSAGSGDVLSLQVLVENKNAVSLQGAELTIDFPEGARYPGQSDRVFERFHKMLGVIAPGEVRTETVKAIFLGEEKDLKNLAISANYRIEGSDAKFTKNKGYSVSITAPALAVKTELQSEATAGQEITLALDVESHSTFLLKGSLLQVDYPQGFEFANASPAPSFGDNAWKLGDMEQGDVRHIEVKGTIRGENAQEKVFRIYTGSVKSESSPEFATIFSSLLRGLVIKKPFLGVEIAINGSPKPDFVFDSKASGNTSVSFRNNLPDKIIDAGIEVSIKGGVINRKTILPQNDGFYRSADDVLFWDKRASTNLKLIPPGVKNSVAFTFALLPLASADNTVFRNPEIEMSVSVKGKRVSENNVPEEINSFVVKKYKVATDLQFSQRGLYYIGSFPNTGPIPPEVGKETTYTILWSIKNTSNDISDAVVTTTLPASVEWKDLVSPAGADITYNPVSHEITWDVGTIKAGTGYETEPQEVSFQVGLTPGLAQAGQTPNLVSQTIFSGKDNFTGLNIERKMLAPNTMLQTDPQFDSRNAVVVP